MRRPNIVFILSDQHRWDFMGYENAGVTFTPNLDVLGETGVTFRSAYCTSPLCSPSRAAIALGRSAIHSGCFTNLHEPPPGSPSWVGQLRAAGYRTMAVGKTHMEIHAYDADYTSPEHLAYMDSLGWDDTCEVSGSGMLKTGIRCAYSEFLKREGVFEDVLAFYKRWRYFMDPGSGELREFECQEWPFDERFHESRFIADRATAWLQENAATGPFLLHVGFAAPHSPIEPLPRFMNLYRDRKGGGTGAPPPNMDAWRGSCPATNDAEPLPWGVDACEPRMLNGRRGYRAMISEIDECVGRIRALLANLGVLEDTLFVYTADHGDMAGDFGLTGKVCFFEGSVHVPLVISGPGVAGGPKSDAFVEGIDLGKTLCELCSVEPHDLDEGLSFLPVLSRERDTHRECVVSTMGCDRMIFDGKWKLMWGDPLLDERKLGRLHLDKPANIPPSPPRLYDLESDPHELCDLANDPASKPIIESLVAKLGSRTLEGVTAQPNKSRGEYKPL